MNIFSHDPNKPLTKEELEVLNTTEWLVTNGLGGYASGTIGGTPSRAYHGYLIAALPLPVGRTIMMNHILEEVWINQSEPVKLNGLQIDGQSCPEPASNIATFQLDCGLPVWTYEIGGLTLEKRVYMPHRQNTTYIHYRIAAGSGKVVLRLQPLVNMRGHEASVNAPLSTYTLSVCHHHFELKPSNQIPAVRMMLVNGEPAFAIAMETIHGVTYELERSRGYVWRGDLWSPGFFSAKISPSQDATFVISTESWTIACALAPTQAWDLEQERRRRLLIEAQSVVRDETTKQLVFAADQFIFTPVGRQEDIARARAAGDELRSIIAGYHWFTDWGRDTMISLEGLTLITGRFVEASYILRTFAHYIRDGLIPNMFPEGEKDGLYHTADATLWLFHALSRYLYYTGDEHLLRYFIPHLIDVVGHHLRGTKFNIHVDPEDGLLTQGQEGYQLTWMDAKVGDWVVTPRRGKAVEINALWYNALRLLENWLRRLHRAEEANSIAAHAAKAKQSFNKRFWYQEGGYLYDVVDGKDGRSDPACRPNQIFALSLEHPILEREHWESVLDVVQKKLLTPFGLRSLAPGEKDYKSSYDGDLRARDAAYHQGTVWAWLIGPFIDAWLKVHPGDRETAKTFLHSFADHLASACAGTISEIFDAEPPFTPRGCCAQAWSVAEVLRCFAKTAERAGTQGPQPLVAEMVT
jgi:predicted glycogen debranching enzyme